MRTKRILLKLSGEVLKGSNLFGYDLDEVTRIAQDIVNATKDGLQISIVIGGGNLFRGAEHTSQGFDKVSADFIGMMATVMNAAALQSVIEKLGVKARVFSSLYVDKVCIPYSRDVALSSMSEGSINIFAGGTGNPFVTTDTASVIKALEMRCDIILKATKVDGVYDSDPHENKSSHRFDEISYDAFLNKSLKVMDSIAIAMAQEHNMPICVFDITKNGSLSKAAKGEGDFTLIK